MNTLTINSSRPLIWRFAWKEYRMLRGFWIAAYAIGVFIQMLPFIMDEGLRTDPEGAFFVAWAAAALYTVGAAITMFCAETEEHTRDYLRLLPGDWRYIFATKCACVLVTALLLQLALMLTGWWLANYRWPEARYAQTSLAVVGVAVLEAFAWGLLFSLWWKQPLIAAVAAIACASFGAQVAVGFTSDTDDVLSLEAYAQAVPIRLLISLAVFAVDVLLAREWLYPRSKQNRQITQAVPTRSHSASSAFPSRRTKLTRLVWQTWRQSWRTILIGVPLSIALMVAFIIPAFIQSTNDFLQAVPYVSLLAPALLGSLAFRADHPRAHRLFLATHSIKPRSVWLSRHVVWFGFVLILCVVVNLVGSQLMSAITHSELTRYFGGSWSYYVNWMGREFSTEDPPWTQAWKFEFMHRTYIRGVVMTWAAVFAAYGVGQLCSMLLKQSLLAGFLAIMFSLLLAVWSLVMYFWEMNPLVFVLPIGIVSLVATWLRTPNWILGKNHWRQWLVLALTIVLPLAGMVSLVPSTRMAQLDNAVLAMNIPNEPFADADAKQAQINREGQQTQLAYERLAAQIDDSKEKFLRSSFGRTNTEDNDLNDLAKKVVEITKKPYCAFPSNEAEAGPISDRIVPLLQLLLSQDALRLESRGELDDAFDRHAAEIRLLGHRLQNRASWSFADVLDRQGFGSVDNLFSSIVDWANAPDQTSARIKQAISTLEDLFANLPQLSDAIHADRERVRRVLLEELPVHDGGSVRALFFNRFPGEQARGLRALDILSRQAQDYVTVMENLIRLTTTSRPDLPVDQTETGWFQGGSATATQASDLRKDLATAPWSSSYAIHPSMFDNNRRFVLVANQVADACATSFLVSREFRSSGNLRHLLITWTDFQAKARALIVRLALIAYRIDHGKYPDTLAALWPDYLSTAMYDPYSGEPFRYHPNGLNLPLRPHYHADSPERDIPAGTPLIWSVGLGNAILQEHTSLVDNNLEGPVDPLEENQEQHAETLYSFYPTEQTNMARLCFTLPKVDSEEKP